MKRTIVPKKEQFGEEPTNFQRILNILYLRPEVEFSLTELASHAGVGKSAVSRILPVLKKNGIVTVRSLGIIHRIMANTESFSFVKKKISWNIETMYATTIIEYLDEFFHHPKSIVLFGSFRNGQDVTGSDIDIAIESVEEREVQNMRLPELHNLERELQRPIQIHLFNRKKIDDNVFSNIANGIVLKGYLEVRK